MAKETGLQSPGIALFIWGIGWLGTVGGAVAAFMTLADHDGPFMGLEALAAGIVMIGFGTVIDRLSRIEYHLRIAGQLQATNEPVAK